MKNKFFFFIILNVLWSFSAYSQGFSKVARFTNSNGSGFANIWLSPEINSKLSYDFHDLRIYNSKNKEIPYILQSEKIQNHTVFFREYKIIEKKHYAAENYTRIIIHNSEKKVIDNISVIIKNAEVKKWLKLNGSDDNKTYYVLNDNYIYNSEPNVDGTSEIKVLHFPTTDYEYLELLVSDYFDKPINVLTVGYYDYQIENGLYSEIKIANYEQSENNEKQESTINFAFAESQYIDKIEFQFEGPTYYLRNAELFYEVQVLNKKQKAIKEWQLLESFEINSYSNATILTDNLKAEKFKLVIKNNDNEVLKIKSIKARQLTKYITAELEKDEEYTIKFSNSEAKKPNYDLKFFTDSIDKNLPLIKVNSIQEISQAQIPTSKSIFTSTYVWVILSFVVLGLGFMSFKMMKDMKK